MQTRSGNWYIVENGKNCNKTKFDYFKNNCRGINCFVFETLLEQYENEFIYRRYL